MSKVARRKELLETPAISLTAIPDDRSNVGVRAAAATALLA